jgi:hypothetical protein
MRSVISILIVLAAQVSARGSDPTPLDKMPPDMRYKGEAGGLYGQGKNDPPEMLARRVAAASELIKPIEGKIGMLSIGMSNTSLKFQAFMRLAKAHDAVNPALVFVNGAQGAMDATAWATPDQRAKRDAPSPWDVVVQRLIQAHVTPEQIQIVWMLHAHARPERLGPYPRHANQLARDQEQVLQRLNRMFPNLRLVYISSRAYAGYAQGPLNPEPYAYESAFAARAVVLNHLTDESGPVVVWGPYLWNDANYWHRDDFAQDGTHPSPQGARKAAKRMLEIYRDGSASRWFGAR